MMPRVRVLKYLRDDLADVSQGQLQKASGVDAHYICGAEKHGNHLYTPQARKLCDWLGWLGDPEELTAFTDEVEDLEQKIDYSKIEKLRAMGASGELGRRRGGRRSKAAAADRGAVDGAAGGVLAEAVR